MSAKGDIHLGSGFAASVALNDRIYLFGGLNARGNRTNGLSTLSPGGRFRRIAVVGDLPLPRDDSVGWTFEADLYFGFGSNYGESRRERGVKYIEGGNWTGSKKGEGYTNEILKFNRKRKSFSPLLTTGSPPAPRDECGVAKQDDKIFVHGGKGEGRNPLRDFFQLDMKTRQWTELREFGLSRASRGQSLSVISPNQLLLVGGGDYGQYISNSVLIYDTAASSWTEDQRLPAEFCGAEGGLWRHKAVVVKEGNRASKVICLGGNTDKDWIIYPDRILEFDLSP